MGFVADDERDERGDLKGDLNGLDTDLVFWALLLCFWKTGESFVLKRTTCWGLGVMLGPLHKLRVGLDAFLLLFSTSSDSTTIEV